MTEADIINKVASFLNVKPGKLEFNDEQVITRVTPKLKCSGLSTILNTIVRESTHDLAKRTNPVYLQNWFDYVRMFCLTGDKQINQQLVKELDSVFSTRSYLIDQYLSVADVALFYSLQTIMKNLSNADKEQYCNLSRWYLHLQLTPAIQQKGTAGEVNFATIQLLAQVQI